MVLINTTPFILAIGFCIACLLLPWISHIAYGLTIRQNLFVISQIVLLMTFLCDTPTDIKWLTALFFLPLFSISEQIRFLYQSLNHKINKFYYYQISIGIAAIISLFIPFSLAISLSSLCFLVSLAVLFAYLYPQNPNNDRANRSFLLASTLVTISHTLALALHFFEIQAFFLQSIMMLILLGGITINLLSLQTYQILFDNKQANAIVVTHPPKELEEQKQSLSSLSHDMRTPLSGILGMTELLLDSQLTPTQREYTQTIQSSGNVLLHLINDRLDWNPNHQEKNLTILEEVLDLTELVNYCLDSFKNEADDKSIDLLSDMDSALPKEILGDAVRLRQILCRFLHNAIRFTERGTVVLSIKSSLYKQELGILFSIQDTGIGLTENQLLLLLKQAQEFDQNNAWHIGPNVATCKDLIEQMGGQLHINSVPYEGTVMTFTLPLKTPSSFNESTTEFIASFAGKRLLVVDDNRTVTKILAEQATQWGMRVSTAENGTEALAVARNAANLGQAFDVIIMDYQMPGMSGLQLGARLKEDALITNDVILIMLTGLRQNNIQNLAKNAGIHRVLSKPITNKQLRQVISQELKRLQNSPHIIDFNTGALGKLKILIAEDNQLSQKVIRGMMQKLGIEHTLVNNGREAVHAVMQGHFDILLMDCDMPIMDGYTATQEIRRWEKQEHRQAMPILALTAHTLDEQRQKALNAGMNKHLSKPIELGDLQNALLEFSH